MDVERKSRGAADPDAEVGLRGAGVADGERCAWPGCTAAGAYPAPRCARHLRSFIWFCLEHIREYNKSWNYFAGMDEAQIEAHRRADTTWHRPSWRFGVGGTGDASRFRDPFGFFEYAEAGPHANGFRESRGRGTGKDEQMMAVLDLEEGFTHEELKQRYKTLVKRHHPDLNGGDRDAEERLKQINEAYTHLLANRLHRS